MQMYEPAPIRSLYIHWPFCPYKCHYCPFVAIASHDEYMEQYHYALKKEIEQFAQEQSEKLTIDTIFFGGGTPSTYPTDLLLDISDTLKDIFVIQPNAEVTIEVNPGTVTAEQLPLWKAMNINRLSIGVQSIKDDVLVSLNRHQKVADVRSLLQDASRHFDALSIDLILGLPNVTREEWRLMLQEVVTWPINHISIYFLTIHEDTPLYFKVKTSRITLPNDDEMVEAYHWTREYLESYGFMQYELSNFARYGYESRHNSVYWDRRPYRGFGLGACSFDGAYRFQNEKNLMIYMNNVQDNKPIIIFSEQLTAKQIHLERLMLGLRRREGIVVDSLLVSLSEIERNHFITQKDWGIEHGFLIEKQGAIALTPQGLVIENEIVSRLIL